MNNQIADAKDANASTDHRADRRTDYKAAAALKDQQRIEDLNSFIDNVDRPLARWTDLIRDVRVPSPLAPALMTGRPELIDAVEPTDLSAVEVRVLYYMISTLLATNQALQRHAEKLATMHHAWTSTFQGMTSVGHRIEAFAAFKHFEG